MNNLKKFEKDREVRIFISSTFSDMHDIRNRIVNELTPVLKRKFEKQNITINFIDLRWGITDDMVTKGNVMDICFREIDKCRPFFIGIIGDRYGSPIPISKLKDNPLTKAFYEEIIKEFKGETLSATELEIQYAILKNLTGQKMDSYFLIKAITPDNTLSSYINRILNHNRNRYSERENIRLLIDRIRNYKYNDPNMVIYDTSDFTSTFIDLQESLSTKINKYFPFPAVYSDSIDSFQLHQIEKASKIKYPTKSDFHYFDDFLSGNKAVLLINKADEKSNYLIANWLKFENENKYIPLCFFPMSFEKDINSIVVACYLWKKIRELSGKTNTEDRDEFSNPKLTIDEKLNILAKEIANIIKQKKIVIIIPNIDIQGVLYCHILSLINNLFLKSIFRGDSLKIIATYSESSYIESFVNNKSVSLLHINNFSLGEKFSIVKSYLTIYGKQDGLSKQQSEMIINMPISTIGTISLLDYLATHSTHVSLASDLSGFVISTINDTSLFEQLLKAIENSLKGEKKTAFKKILSYLVLSGNGISENDLINLCEEASIIDIIIWENNFSNLINYEQGRIFISNAEFSKCIDKLYIKSQSLETKLRENLVSYYAKSDTAHSYNELLFQYNKLNFYDELYELVAKNKHAIMYFIKNRPYDYAKIWDKLWHENKIKYDISALENTFNHINNLKDTIACNYLSEFFLRFCNNPQIAMSFAKKNSSYYDNNMLHSISLLTEAQLLRDINTMDTHKKALDVIIKAIEELHPYTIIQEESEILKLVNIRFNEMKELKKQLEEDLSVDSFRSAKTKKNEDALALYKSTCYLLAHSGNIEEAICRYRLCLDLIGDDLTDTKLLSNINSQLGYCFYSYGEYNNALSHFKVSYDLNIGRIDKSHYSSRNICYYISVCYEQLGNHTLSNEYLNKMIELEKTSINPSTELVEVAKKNLQKKEEFRNTLSEAKDILLKNSNKDDSGIIEKAIHKIDIYLNS